MTGNTLCSRRASCLPGVLILSKETMYMHNIPNLVSIKDFSDILNASTNSPIGETAIYQLVKTPGFPALIIGNRYYILIDKV